MIRSGFGDLLGKYTALADWKLSSIINSESYSEEIAAQVRTTVDRTVAHLQGTITSPETIRNLMEGLIASGAAMLEWGNSGRPPGPNTTWLISGKCRARARKQRLPEKNTPHTVSKLEWPRFWQRSSITAYSIWNWWN